jgi:hypothetical protein
VGEGFEDGLLRHATEGAPQGGVISPCLSNVFPHYVLDEWFETEVNRVSEGVRRLPARASTVAYLFRFRGPRDPPLFVLALAALPDGWRPHPGKGIWSAGGPFAGTLSRGRFKWKDYRIKGRDRLKTMTLDAGEFIVGAPVKTPTAAGRRRLARQSSAILKSP